MAVRFNNYQPGAQFAAALDQADRQYQDKLALGWVPSERDPDQGIFGSFWDSFTSSAESSLGGALTSVGVMADSPWIAGLGGDLTRRSAQYADWGNDYDDNPNKSRYSLEYLLDPHGLWSDAGVMAGSSAPGMLSGMALGAAVAGTGGMALPAIGVLASAGLEVGANFGQGYMDKKRDNIEAQIKAGQRPTGSVYDGNIDQAAWDDLTKDPWKNAELIGSSFMDTALDVATGMSGGLVSMAGKGLAKAGLLDAMASGGGKVAGAILGDAARADTMLGRAAYGLSKAGRPLEFAGNRVANALGEGVQEAWQQRVQDGMGQGFGDDRDDAGSFFRDLANGNWDNFTDDEKNSFNAAFLPTLITGIGGAGIRKAGQYAYDNTLGERYKNNREYEDLVSNMNMADAMQQNGLMNGYVANNYAPDNPIVTHSDVDANTNINVDLSAPTDTVMPSFAKRPAPTKQEIGYDENGLPTVVEVPQYKDVYGQVKSELDNQVVHRPDITSGDTSNVDSARSELTNGIQSRLQDVPDILQRAYNNADIDTINQAIPEGNEKLSPQMLNAAMRGDSNAANYMLQVLGKKNVVAAIKQRKQEQKDKVQAAKAQIKSIQSELKDTIKGIGDKNSNQEAIAKAQDIIHSLAPNGKAEELAPSVKSRFLQVNQELLDRANNGDTKAIRDILRAVDPKALVTTEPATTNVQQNDYEPLDEPTQEGPTQVPQTIQTGEDTGYSTGKQDVPQSNGVTTPTQNNDVVKPKVNMQTQQTPNNTAPSNDYIPGGAIDNNGVTRAPNGGAAVQQNVQNGANSGYSTQNTQVPDKSGVTTPQPNGTHQNQSVYTPTGATPNTATPNGMIRGEDSNRVKFIHSINTPEDVERGINVIKQAKNNGLIAKLVDHLQFDHASVSRALQGSVGDITNIISAMSDEDFDKFDNTGGKTNANNTDQTTEGSTDDKAEKGTENRGNPHQQGRVNNNAKGENSTGTEGTHEQTDEKKINDAPLFKNDGGTIEEDNDKHDRVNEVQAETTLHRDRTATTTQDKDNTYHSYVDNKLSPELETTVGAFYASQNKMSFANLVTMLPDAIEYIKFLNGNQNVFNGDKAKEMQCLMNYRAVCGSLYSLGINLLKKKATIANATNSQGQIDFNSTTNFGEVASDVFNILPAAINSAIITYDGVKAAFERRTDGKPSDIPSLNTWFYFCLEDAYDRYATQRAGSGLVLAEHSGSIGKNEVYSVLGDLFPQNNMFAHALLSQKIPDSLSQYGIKSMIDLVSWLDNDKDIEGRKTGRRFIQKAWQNAMQHGHWRQELLTGLQKAKENNNYNDYAKQFVAAFSDVFTTLVSTPEGQEAWHTYRSMRKLDDIVTNDIRQKIEESYNKKNGMYADYSMQFLLQVLGGDGRADKEFDVYEDRVIQNLEDKIKRSQFLTREGRAVGLTKLAIIKRAIELAKSARKHSAIYGEYIPPHKGKSQNQNGSTQEDKSTLGSKLNNRDKGNGYSINADFANRGPLNAISEDYRMQARLARRLEIMSFEIQMCNLASQLGDLHTSALLKRVNQDEAYLSPTDKARLMQAFIVCTIENNFGDINNSDFKQHSKSSDSETVREYGLKLISRINRMFPTTITKKAGDVNTQIKDLDENLNKLCEEIQKDPIGKKLFGLVYSKNIVCTYNDGGVFKDMLMTRRTPTFPWLKTKTSGRMMSADTFDRSKFVKNYVAKVNKKAKEDITVSDIMDLEKSKEKKRQATEEVYSNNMKTYGFSNSTIHDLAQFNGEWKENLWNKASKKAYPTVPTDAKARAKYNKDRTEFMNRLNNAINKARRAVLSVASMGAGKYNVQDELATLKMDFAVAHGVTSVDAVLLSKALAQHIQELADDLVKNQKIFLNTSHPGHRVQHLNAFVYNYAIGDQEKGIDQGRRAAEKKDGIVISYKHGLYAITQEEADKLSRGEIGKEDVCHPSNRVVKSVRTIEGDLKATGQTTGLNPYLIDNRVDKVYTDTPHNGFLISSGTIVGNIDTFIYDFFRVRDGISNNIALKTLLVVNSKLPLDTIIHDGLDNYIADYADKHNMTLADARKKILNQLKNEAVKFMKQEQLDIGLEKRDQTRMKMFGTVINYPNSAQVKFKEGPSEIRNLLKFIASIVDIESMKNKPEPALTKPVAPTQKSKPKQTVKPQTKPIAKPTPVKATLKPSNNNVNMTETEKSLWVDRYDKLSRAFRSALTSLANKGGMYSVVPMKVNTKSTVLRDKGILNGTKVMTQEDRKATTTTVWTTGDFYSPQNPFAGVLRLLGGLRMQDLEVHVTSPVATLYDEIRAKHGNSLIAFSGAVNELDDAGLITSAHLISYKLAQKKELTYSDVNTLVDLLTIIQARAASDINFVISAAQSDIQTFSVNTNRDADPTSAPGKVTTTPYSVEVHDKVPGTYNVKATNVSVLSNLATEREQTSKDTVITMNKENAEFLTGMNLHVSDNANTQFAHTLFVNIASKVLGVAPSLLQGEASKTANGLTYTSSRNITATRRLPTIYHELMHVAQLAIYEIDGAKSRLFMTNEPVTESIELGENFISKPRARITRPKDSTEALRQKHVAYPIVKNALNKAMKELNKSDTLTAKMIHTMGSLVDLDAQTEACVNLLIDSGLACVRIDKATGAKQFVTKLTPDTMFRLYRSSFTSSVDHVRGNIAGAYSALESAILIPCILMGNAETKVGKLHQSLARALMEAYSSLISVEQHGKFNVNQSIDSDFASTWLYKSTELLRAIEKADPNGEMRNWTKVRIDDNKSVKEAIANLTNIKEIEEQENTMYEKAEELLPPSVSDKSEVPDSKVMQVLQHIADKRNPTMNRTVQKKGGSASLWSRFRTPTLSWFEKLIDSEEAKHLIDLGNRCIEWQKKMNAQSDNYVKQLRATLTFKGNKIRTRQLQQYFNDAINEASERGRDLVELFDMPVEAGQDERCMNHSESGQHAMLKVYEGDTFIQIHQMPNKEIAQQKINDKVQELQKKLEKEGKKVPENQAFWYDEKTGTATFYACPSSRMADGQFKNLFVSAPTQKDGKGAEAYTNMRMRLLRDVMNENDKARREKMKTLGFDKAFIDQFIKAHALYRGLLTNAYIRERKREMRNEDIIGQQRIGFIHAYSPRYYARYILRKEVWTVLPKGSLSPSKLKAELAEGTVVKYNNKYYRVQSVGLGSFSSKSERARYRNEHKLASNERYVEMTRDDWMKQHGGESDAFTTPIHSMGNVTNSDVSKATRDIKKRTAGILVDFISKYYPDKQPWEGKKTIKNIVDKLEHMPPEDKAVYGEHKEDLIRLAKGLRINAKDIVTMKQLKDSIINEGTQFLAGRYAQERVSKSGNYSRDVIGSLQQYLHAVNNIESLTPFYRNATKTIKEYTGREYSKSERDSFETNYNIMCDAVDVILGRTPKPTDKLLRQVSAGAIEAIYKITPLKKLFEACNIHFPDMWLPSLIQFGLALQVPLKLGMLNVATGLAQYAQLSNVYAMGGEEAFAYAMKRMPGIMKKAHNPFMVLKGDFDVSEYDDAIRQVMADMNLTKEGKMLLEKDAENAFKRALIDGNPEAYELQAFDDLYSAILGEADTGSLSDLANQLSDFGNAYEGEPLLDRLSKNAKKLSDLSMILFSGADKSMRVFSAMVAEYNIKNSPKYAAWREAHKSDTPAQYNEAMMLEMRDFINRTNFTFNRGMDPLLVAKGGLLAKCVFQFASYGFQQLRLFEYMWDTGKKKELAKAIGSMMLFSGVVAGIPMMTMMSGLCEAIFGTNPEDWIKDFVLRAAGKSNSGISKAAAEAFCYGIFAPILGIDISKKIGVADIMKDPTDVRNLMGPAVGMAIDLSTAAGATYDAMMYDKYTTDQLMFAWFKSVPALTRYLQAGRGQYYSYSKLMPKTEYQSMSGTDRVRNVLGFNPIDNRMNTDINRYITDKNQDYSNSVREAMIAYVNNPTEANLAQLKSYGKTPEDAKKAVGKMIKPKITAEQAEKMVTKAKNDNADVVRNNVRALGNMLN